MGESMEYRKVNAAQLILAALAEAPAGMTLLELTPKISRSFRQTQKSACTLLDAGMVARELTAVKGRVVFCLPHQIATVRAECHAAREAAAEDARRRVRERQAKRAAAKRAHKAAARRAAKAAAIAADEEAADKPFVHRMIPAHLAKPLVKRGVSSVWELAA